MPLERHTSGRADEPTSHEGAPFAARFKRPVKLCYLRRIGYLPGVVPGSPRVAERFLRFLLYRHPDTSRDAGQWCAGAGLYAPIGEPAHGGLGRE